MMLVPRPINCIIFGLVIGILSSNANKFGSNVKLKIAIIGAGVSGLASAKHSLGQGHNVVIWEQSEELGGIWYYTNKTGKDKYGVDIYTPMYKDLRTNAPYQILEFPSWKFPNGTQSYPTQKEVWKYIASYAKHFGIDKVIKYHHKVTKVQSIEGNKWRIDVKDVAKKVTKTSIFDAVFVCSGIFSVPIYPNIKDIDKFKGKAIHSRDYRSANEFQGKNVLVIGGGPSGKDITIHIAAFANRVTLSRHDGTAENRKKQQIGFIPKVTFKCDVKRLTNNEAVFEDGSRQIFDAIIFATGYAYSYPFLDENTGIRVKDNYIEPLYKHIINIEHPSMAFIGAASNTATMPMHDLQARFALQFIAGAKKLPSQDDMRRDMETRNKALWNKGVAKSKTHSIAFNHKDYANQLAETAGIQNIPTVISDMFEDILKTYQTTDPFKFRSNIYTIIDDKQFVKIKV